MHFRFGRSATRAAPRTSVWRRLLTAHEHAHGPGCDGLVPIKQTISAKRHLSDRYLEIPETVLKFRYWPVSDRRVRQLLTVGKPTFHLLGDLQRVIDLDAEIPHHSLKFGMAE